MSGRQMSLNEEMYIKCYAHQVSDYLLHSKLIIGGFKRSPYSFSASVGHLRWRNALSYKQRHNHVFKVGGRIPWSMVLLSFYTLQKKLDRSTQFGAVGYIITLYSSKSYVKSWGSVQILGRSGPPSPRTASGCAHGYK